jgi:uncharacterized protein (TIGR02246 family)
VEGPSLDLESLREAYARAWAARDPDRIAALHTVDTQFHAHVGNPAAIGREALRATCAMIFETFRNFTPHVQRIIYGDRHWVLEWTLQATTSVERDGKQVDQDVSVDCLDVVVVSDEGLVVRKDTYMDVAQLNAVFKA